ncbi:MAG: acyl-CoA thioesterase [Candidatus Paracaedibacteraceae bacterium]|nr:acyl-CoA thioesterase [Candidatus Paracaedibacteraceae bacterium]
MTVALSIKYPIKIHYFDVDPMNVVWHGNYVRFMEMARTALIAQVGYDYAAMDASGYVWPIVDMRLKYIRPIMLQQSVIIEATLVEYENRIVVDYKFIDQETGKLLTKATTIQVAVKMGNTSMDMVCPPDFVNRVKQYLETPVCSE